VATAPFTADDRSDSHAHGAPAESSRSQQLRADVVNRARARALLAPGHADVVDAHQARQFDGQLAAHA